MRRDAPPRCSDLLCPSRDNLQVHEGPRGTYVGNATEARAPRDARAAGRLLGWPPTRSLAVTLTSPPQCFSGRLLTRAAPRRAQVRVASETEVLYWLAEGVKNRAVGCTQLNAESSRSHLILTLTVERAAASAAGGGTGGAAAHRVGKLLLVDLAGSEKVKKTGARARAHTRALCDALSARSATLTR